MGIIVKPIVTEKMTKLGEKLNRYGFKVEKGANKIEIKQAVEAMYNVTVTDVNTLIVAPKQKSRFTKSGVISGKASAYKKAVVTVKDGEQIDFYSNI
ncbi:MAG: 50S ribosomal protein L23 [Porphyromonadaceae bacterium CG2_30_38_12]|nr:MAG: 50S ribosomal protein L23 [Porphyromonadaceae bacterium CG2_30_38_12]